METVQSNTHLKAVVQQITNNTTSWIGHWQGETKNRITGQTFFCPAEGDLDCIEVLSNYVTSNGSVDMTIHVFDPINKSWGPVIGSSKVEFTHNDTGKWIAFPLSGLHLHKGTAYGFRLKSETGLVGVGEAAGSVNQLPYIGGQEWVATTDDQSGNYYTYLSLAFKVELRA
ncbi:MAG: hypothetical protein WBP16_16380 [Ferruginibacter sp.]